ncbi:MAG: CoA pyrophosphatase [Bacteroidetes bacterium]|nr:CoA pyrophosphatase [Bacteroidota bacterium]
MLSELSRQLRQRLALPLPGIEAQYQMAHAERRVNLSRYRIPENVRKGSVLLLLYEKNGEIMFPLIVRQEYEGVHSGQVALPGGKYEEEDGTLEYTAIRESHEEIGIIKRDISLIGQLTELYIPPSNFLVQPFIGTLNYEPTFLPDAKEVARVVEISLENLMDEHRVSEKVIKLSNGMEILTPYFSLRGNVVWGATAMMLAEMKSVLYEIGY